MTAAALAAAAAAGACRIDVTDPAGGAVAPEVQVQFMYSDTTVPGLELRVHLNPGRDADHVLRPLEDDVVRFGALEMRPADVDEVYGWRHYKASLSGSALVLASDLVVPLPGGDPLTIRLDAYRRAAAPDTILPVAGELRLPIASPTEAWNAVGGGSWSLEMVLAGGKFHVTSAGLPPDTIVLPVSLIGADSGSAFTATAWIAAYRSSFTLPATADPETAVNVSYSSTLQWRGRL